MRLDEAIKHAEEIAKKQENNAKSYPRPDKSVKGSGRKYNAYLKCAEEHRQLAEWLRDYKRLLEQEPCDELDFVQPHKKIPVNLEVCKMREATQKEREGVEQYIDSIAEPCEDYVSRQAVLDAISSERLCYTELYDLIKHLSPVTPQELKTGWWIEVMEGNAYRYKCTKCNELVVIANGFTYCPHCGAKMESGD